jgi:serine/threonine protein kinase
VIIYILLCGYPPFFDEEDDVLYEKIKGGVLEFDPEFWNGISEGPVDLIKSALVVDARKRPSAEELLSHPWFRLHLDVSKEDLTPAAAKLKSWQARKTFKGGVKALVAMQRMQKGASSN